MAADNANIASRLDSVDWNGFDLVHAELGGGRLGEFIALREAAQAFPAPAAERHGARSGAHGLAPRAPALAAEPAGTPASPLPQAAVVLADPLTLREERAVAQGLTRLVTLTGLGGECLARRMRRRPGGSR